MGISGLSTFQGDLVLAQAARDEQALMVASATSLMPLERLSAEGGARWFQTDLPGEPERIEAMLARVAAAGFETLVLTVMFPSPPTARITPGPGSRCRSSPASGCCWTA